MKKRIEGLLKSAQISQILEISELTIKRLAKDGELPCIYINRQPQFDLDQIIEYFEGLERSVA